MTQIELETRLSEIEADYASRISDYDTEIKNSRIRIEQLHASHDIAVSKEKQHILNLESRISNLKALKLEQKAAVYKQFLAEQNDNL